jgi:hypothetical protein
MNQAQVAQQIEMVPWHCPEGHELSAPANATGVWCNRSGHRGTNAMKPKHLYPKWAHRALSAVSA